jgi:hypothetical protein
LINEAKKYKTFDEFKNNLTSKNNIVEHVTSKESLKKIEKD